jgi:hypothetical protein
VKLLLLPLIALLVSAQTTRYPGALDSDSSLFVVSDNVQTTLTAAMSTSDTAAVVASAAGFVPNMIATICDTSTNTGKCTAWEHMLVTTVAGNILTVTRAFAGTAARSHSSGRLISALIDSAHQKVLKDAVVAVQTALGPNLSNISSTAAVVNAATVNFSAYSCNSSSSCAPGGPSGMSLIAGNNSLTMTPVPSGVNGSDTGHYVYVSGGTGTAEACLITGGSGTSGQASGQIIMNCPGTHSGAWTMQSGSGGIQEAICSLPSTGGDVALTAPATLRANVAACGKTAVRVSQLSGAAISGAFTIFGRPAFGAQSQTFQTASYRAASSQSATFAAGTPFDMFMVALNTSTPNSLHWGAGSGQVVSAITGVADYSTSALGGGMGVGVSGYVGAGAGPHVGVLGQCTQAAGVAVDGCWGSNFLIDIRGVTNGWGTENDLNIAGPPAPAPANVWGYTAVSAAYQSPTGQFQGFAAQKAGVAGHWHYPFKDGYYSDDGAAINGIRLASVSLPETATKTFATLPAAVAANNVAYRCTDCQASTPCTGGGTGAIAQGVTGVWSCTTQNAWSQPLALQSINPANGLHALAEIYTDEGGNLIFGAQTTAGAAAIMSFQAPIGTPLFSISPNGTGFAGVAFTALGAPPNGVQQYCNNCKNVGDGVTAGAVCVAAGTGAMAFRENGAWRCF